jgi:glycosyltransferase involved in cell wall biosynthesis
MTDEIWPDGPPRDDWHSFDATPWWHPWLSFTNLRAMRAFSSAIFAEAEEVVQRAGHVPDRFAFVGNIANGMYLRAVPVSRVGGQITVFGIDGEEDVFSDARWEEYDGVIPASVSYLKSDRTFLNEVTPRVPFERVKASAIPDRSELPSYIRAGDFDRWPAFFTNLPLIDRLRSFEAVLASQIPYYAYLANRPYLALSMSGDLWLEASRDDALGRLQRAAFANAECIFVTNPWTFSHARRFGMKNCIYLPLGLDEEMYSPGPPVERRKWQEQSGGDFFVLSSARADEYYKGTQIGFRGFAEFARRTPGARLVFATWGKDIEGLRAAAHQFGIADRLLFVPVSGKRKLVDYYRSADCLLDQFKVGYFGATGLEAAACGLPVIIRLEFSQYEALHPESGPPFLNAATYLDVINALDLLYGSKDRRRDIADRHRDWFLRNQSGRRWAKQYFNILAATALGHRFSFDSSPLNSELSPLEKIYHAEQLAAAPQFPNYEPTKAAPPGPNIAESVSNDETVPEAGRPAHKKRSLASYLFGTRS